MSTNSLVRVRISLAVGSAVAEIDLVRAPRGAGAFLSLVEQGRYDGAHIYRRVRTEDAPEGIPGIDVVQFGLAIKNAGESAFADQVPHEPTGETGLKHVRGTLSLARLEPGTARSEVFVTLRDSPELDQGGKRQPDGQGFSAFGRIVEGIDLFEAIHRSEPREVLAKPIKINSIRRLAERDGRD